MVKKTIFSPAYGNIDKKGRRKKEMGKIWDRSITIDDNEIKLVFVSKMPAYIKRFFKAFLYALQICGGELRTSTGGFR